MKTTFGILTAGLLLTSAISYAGHGKEGGEILLKDKASLILYLKEGAKKDLQKMIKAIANDELMPVKGDYYQVDQEFISSVKELNNKGILSDIDQSKYELKLDDSCLDTTGKEKDASTGLIMNDDVCWSVSRLSQRSMAVNRTELIGLAFHEHVHHFGIVDEDHTLFAKMAMAAETYFTEGSSNMRPSSVIKVEHSKKRELTKNEKLISFMTRFLYGFMHHRTEMSKDKSAIFEFLQLDPSDMLKRDRVFSNFHHGTWNFVQNYHIALSHYGVGIDPYIIQDGIDDQETVEDFIVYLLKNATVLEQ